MTTDSLVPQVNNVYSAWESSAARVPRPILQACFAQDRSTRANVRRGARIVWGNVTQNQNLGCQVTGPAANTAEAVEDAVFDQNLDEFPYKCFELCIRKEDQCFGQWFDKCEPEAWAHLLRFQRKRHEWKSGIYGPKLPLKKGQIACCRNQHEFPTQAAKWGIFLATWSECDPDWNSISSIASRCRIGIWFDTRQSPELTDDLLNQLDGLESYDEVIERIRDLQRIFPQLKCLVEHPRHEPFGPQQSVIDPSFQQQTVLSLD